MSSKPRMVEVRQNVLKQNDLLARVLRRRFEDAGEAEGRLSLA